MAEKFAWGSALGKAMKKRRLPAVTTALVARMQLGTVAHVVKENNVAENTAFEVGVRSLNMTSR